MVSQVEGDTQIAVAVVGLPYSWTTTAMYNKFTNVMLSPTIHDFMYFGKRVLRGRDHEIQDKHS